ncbi:hypothetical protein [Deinococcus altitudinis]|uniref:hypothetical protein n=1 Tax=Deinococcus altitudinis TaxID=468914 RepID=UPI003891200D
MDETESSPAARAAADALERMNVERRYDSLPGTADQGRINAAQLKESSPAIPATDNSDGITMDDHDGETLDTYTLRDKVVGGRPELALASEAVLDVALARLQEEYGAELTEDDLQWDVLVDAVETAMTEAGEMNLETVCERLSDATGISEWLIGAWINGEEQQFPLPEEMAAGLMALRPGLVIKFDKHVQDDGFDGFTEHHDVRAMFEFVVGATGVLNEAEIAWLMSD